MNRCDSVADGVEGVRCHIPDPWILVGLKLRNGRSRRICKRLKSFQGSNRSITNVGVLVLKQFGKFGYNAVRFQMNTSKGFCRSPTVIGIRIVQVTKQTGDYVSSFWAKFQVHDGGSPESRVTVRDGVEQNWKTAITDLIQGRCCRDSKLFVCAQKSLHKDWDCRGRGRTESLETQGIVTARGRVVGSPLQKIRNSIRPDRTQRTICLLPDLRSRRSHGTRTKPFAEGLASVAGFCAVAGQRQDSADTKNGSQTSQGTHDGSMA
jgi:hypothetical protein